MSQLRPAVGEFNLIDTFFRRTRQARTDIRLGIGDDCALLEVPAGYQLAVTTDTMVEGVHFFADVAPRALAQKLVAVNLSDLAAMGAEPAWLSLALTLPRYDEEWLSEFSAGLHGMCQHFHCGLVGGDTTRGPLSLTLTAHGLVPTGQALLRSGAKPGDWLYVSGELGDAGLALGALQQHFQLDQAHLASARKQLETPYPQVALGQALRGIASACIDISDGLIADLGHLLRASKVGAQISLEQLPLSLALTESVDFDQALSLALTAGDDYQLCFTVPEAQRTVLETSLSHTGAKPVCIGRITSAHERSPTLQLRLNGEPYTQPSILGFNHFQQAAR